LPALVWSVVKEPSDETSDRLEREVRFHDDRFVDDTPRHATAKYYGTAGPAKQRYRQLVTDLSAGTDMLEYGCGRGSMAWSAVGLGARVTGIDLSSRAIEQARHEAARRRVSAEFCEMNAESLDFATDSFDLVCGSGILHHLDLTRAYSEIARVLRPDGTAVFYEPLGHNPAINLYRRLTPRLRTPDEHPLMMSDLELAQTWFRHVDAEFHVLTALAASPFKNQRVGPKLVAGLTAFDRRLFERLPRTQRWAWVTIVRLELPHFTGPDDRTG